MPDYPLALDGEEEVGLVRRDLTGGPDEGRWMWSMLLRYPGPAFQRPTNGTTGSSVRRSANCLSAGGRFASGSGSSRGGRLRMRIAADRRRSAQKGDRGIVESVGTLAVTIRLERDPTRRGTLIGANLSGRLLIIDPREGK